MKYTGIWDLLIHETVQLYSISAILEKKRKAMVELEGGRLLTEDISLAHIPLKTILLQHRVWIQVSHTQGQVLSHWDRYQRALCWSEHPW